VPVFFILDLSIVTELEVEPVSKVEDPV
jgi:hypothetical protein